MDLIDFGSILVALIAALGAWAAQRSASRTAQINTSVSGRLEAEREAYQRARAFDIQTIERQNEEIKELHEENYQLRDDLKKVKERLARLEDLYPEWERLLNERLNEPDNQE